MFSKLTITPIARRALASTALTRVCTPSLVCSHRTCSSSSGNNNNNGPQSETYRSGIIQAVRDLAKEQRDAQAAAGETGEAIQRNLNAAAEEVLRRQRQVAGTPAHASADATRAADEKGDFEMPIRGDDVAAKHGHTFRDQRPIDPAETLENKRRRLIYQSRYRGMVEMDLIFGHFARCKLESLEREQLDEYDLLLKQLDNELFRWLVMEQPAPEEVAALKCFQTVKEFVAQEREQLLGHY